MVATCCRSQRLTVGGLRSSAFRPLNRADRLPITLPLSYKGFLCACPHPSSSQVAISYGPLLPDEAALYYGFVLGIGGQEEEDGLGRRSMPLGRLCAADHADFDPQSRPGKNIWPAFEGESSSQRRTSLHSRDSPCSMAVPQQLYVCPTGPCCWIVVSHRPLL